HGSLPHAFLLCSQPSRTAIANNEWVKIPPLAEMVAMHEAIARPLRPAPVIGVAMNTYGLDEAAARTAIEKGAAETGLPCTDVVRFDPAPLVDAILQFDAARRKA